MWFSLKTRANFLGVPFPDFSSKTKKSFLSICSAPGGAAAGARCALSVQIAWRRRAIGSATNQFLLILARMQQSTLPIHMRQNTLTSVINFFVGQNLPIVSAMPLRYSGRHCGAHPPSPFPRFSSTRHSSPYFSNSLAPL